MDFALHRRILSEINELRSSRGGAPLELHEEESGKCGEHAESLARSHEEMRKQATALSSFVTEWQASNPAEQDSPPSQWLKVSNPGQRHSWMERVAHLETSGEAEEGLRAAARASFEGEEGRSWLEMLLAAKQRFAVGFAVREFNGRKQLYLCMRFK